MEAIPDFFRKYPEMAIFLTIGLGFWIGQFRYKMFSLGTVTSVLLVGILVGQMDIPISEPLRSVFFLLFLFAIGYGVGPQFFHSLKNGGVKQVLFAGMMSVLCLLVTVGVAIMMGYNPGQAVGLFSGAQTISAAIGTGADAINTLNMPAEQRQAWIGIIPVAYAVTYIFGTIGSTYIVGSLGPKMLGGLEKVKKATEELEKTLNRSSIPKDPMFINANRQITFRAYKITSEWFDARRTVKDVEELMASLGRQIFVERTRIDGTIKDPDSGMVLKKGDEVVLSGRREAVIQDESWIGDEVDDPELLTFPVENISVVLTHKMAGSGKTVEELRREPFMHGIMINNIRRAFVDIPVLNAARLMTGDKLEIVGLAKEVNDAAPKLGYIDRPTNKTDLMYVGLGILLGGIAGALTIHLGSVPVSLSTSGGALLSGLFFGWLRTKNPSFGYIPDSSLWLMNNLGMNLFIAVIGITAGPSFFQGVRELGFGMLFAGMLATAIPLILGIMLGAKVFKFHPAVTLGCVAGSRTTSAALGAVQESLESTIPALGYTITFAVGNTLLILWGMVIVLMMHWPNF